MIINIGMTICSDLIDEYGSLVTAAGRGAINKNVRVKYLSSLSFFDLKNR